MISSLFIAKIKKENQLMLNYKLDLYMTLEIPQHDHMIPQKELHVMEFFCVLMLSS